MMHDREKSDSAIVATKSTNKAGATAAEPVEPRVGAKGNVGEQSTHRTQSRVRVSQALNHVRQGARQPSPQITVAVRYPRQEPYALIRHVRIRAGGAG